MQIRRRSTIDEPTARQFTLLDAFAMMTFAAIVLALFAPILQTLDPKQRQSMILPVLVQASVVALALAGSFYLRCNVVRRAGKRLGAVLHGTSQSPYWPIAKSMLLMFACAAGQVSIAVLTVRSQRSSLWFVIQTIQTSFIFGLVVGNFFWRCYPGTLEFFEHGVVLGGYQLVKWPCVELRVDQRNAARMAVVLHPEGEIAGWTLMAFVDDALREAIAQAKSAHREQSIEDQ